ncbi:unnamed protein product [Leptidea sinapis]|uniref:Peptidoglycan recognition protein family domain-containing protein n=1 Tax=Leptidea sinapis TaxID=189913 RepID=A0A5E4QYJ1_9NEOP|nr:unnamed protein product [Leptidea sinapis]
MEGQEGQFRTAPRHDDVLSTETYEQTPLLGLTNLGSSPQTSATILAVGTAVYRVVNNTKLSYNFLVSSTGVVLEAFGWQRSPVFSELSVLVIACIGNFNQSAPTHIQVESVARLAAYAVSSGHLVPGYSVLVGTGMPQPPRLLQRLLLLPTWKNKMSYKVYD